VLLPFSKENLPNRCLNKNKFTITAPFQTVRSIATLISITKQHKSISRPKVEAGSINKLSTGSFIKLNRKK